jgi:alanine-glyoxylate transaminase / serine-glyoxylate transaminase / serine-pyruvate transaminase
MRPVLMIPGPVDVDDAVLERLGSPITTHYGPAFVRAYNETAGYLKEVLGTEGDVFLMPGSGTIAIEAALSSLVGVGEKAIIGSNGFFGERTVLFTRSWGGTVIEIKAEWGEALRPEEFERALRQHPDAVAVAVVQFETSTGIMNPVREIARLTKAAGVPLIMDGVSSIGGVPFGMDEWGVDVAITAPQKCLGAPPGLGLIAVAPHLWPRIEARAGQPHGWYCSLNTWRWYQKNWADWHPSPMTMPVNIVLALHEALRQLVAEGLSQRVTRFQKLADHLRQGLRAMGMAPVVPESLSSAVMTAAWGPQGIPTSEIVRFVEEAHGIRIAGGLGAFKDRVFRIGHMSPKTSMEIVDRLLAALADFKLKRTGDPPTPPGA